MQKRNPDTDRPRTVRAEELGGARPACLLLVVAALGDPDHKIQIEAWAAKPSHPLVAPA
ncbi:MAG TPA: hypothetical protein VGM91_18220 [Conexibacter sp.]|jgi:hypothetical protein